MDLKQFSHEEIEKLALEGFILKTLVHEMKNSLAHLERSAMDLTEQLGPTRPEASQLYDRIRDLNKMIQDNRQIFNQELKDPQDLNLHLFFEEIEEFCKYRLNSHKVRITFDIPKNIFILANQRLLKQVFINLLENAIFSISSLEEKWVRIIAQENSEGVEVSVTDSGSIDPEVMEKIFAPLFTTKGNLGSGIGLTLSVMVLKLHRATLDCRLDKNRNTQFRIHFPSIN